MTKAQKQAYVQDLVTQLRTLKAAVLTEYRGTTVAQMDQLRKRLYDKGITYQVAQNNLLKRALQEVGIEVTDPSVLDLPIGIAVGFTDEVEVAKTLDQARKEFETIVPVAGIVSGSFVSADTVQRLAKLPSREELYAKMVGSLAGLPTRMVRTIANPMQGLVNALHQVQTQKEA